MMKKCHFLQKKLTLPKFCIQFPISQYLKHNPQMVLVFILAIGVSQDIEQTY